MLTFVSFEPTASGFQASLSLEEAFKNVRDPAALAQRAEEVYGMSIAKMLRLCHRLSLLRAEKRRTPALLIWELGDAIFELRRELGSTSLELDDVYAHLTRDLGVRRKWLEKVIIFRRYVRTREVVPVEATWGTFEKGTRRKAEQLQAGVTLREIS